MTWNRKEVATLLMTGAGIINAIETAIFSKWVDAKLQLATSSTDSAPSLVTMTGVIAWVGVTSTIVLSGVWIGCRMMMARNLTVGEELDSRVTTLVVLVFVAIATAWGLALVLN